MQREALLRLGVDETYVYVDRRHPHLGRLAAHGRCKLIRCDRGDNTALETRGDRMDRRIAGSHRIDSARTTDHRRVVL